jgi:hypothetical protein
MLNLDWMSTEQEFLHKRVMTDAAKLNREQLLEIFEGVHKQYLIRAHLFSRLASWCAQNSILLPGFDELLAPREVDHPSGLETPES